MANNTNLVLQLLITAKDEASAIFGKLFGYLNDSTNVVATQVREAFSDLFGGGLTSAADLEAALDAVAAKGGYTTAEMVLLKKEAERVAAQFGVTGTEAAKGLEILAAAGLNATDAIKTLPQVLALAKSEGVSLDVAAERLSDSLAIMGLGFEQAGRMADVLAKGANLSTTSAVQLAEALATAGGIARAAGLDLETTVAALDLLAKNGIKGSVAGTALAAILTQLQNPASTASAALNALGISTRDLGGVLDALKAAGGGSETAILAFGETAGPGLRALLGEGSAGLSAFTEQLRNASGASKEAADGMSGNLKSALESLNAAWDAVQRTFAEPVLEPLTKAATNLSKAFQEAVSSGAFSGVQDAVKSLATSAGEAGESINASFDFKALGTNLNTLTTGGMNALGRAMENVTAIAGGLAATALIPLGIQLKAAYDATLAFVAAQRAALAAMTASQIAAAGFANVMKVLAGPAGWILAGVAAVTLLWKEHDKLKDVTDALKGSTEEYTKKLKEQSEAQNQLALLKLNEGLQAQRDKLAEVTSAYDQVNKQGQAYIVITKDMGGIIGKVRQIVSDANEMERLRLERLVEVEEAQKAVTEAEKRRGLIVEELAAKQKDADIAAQASKLNMEGYRKAVDEAAEAHKKAKKAVEDAAYGTRAYADAQAEARVTEINLKAAVETLTEAEKKHREAIEKKLAQMPLARKAAEDYTAVWEKNAAGVPQLITAQQKLGAGIADVSRVTGEAQGAMKAYGDGTVVLGNTLVKADQANRDFTDGLGRMAPQITTVADQIKEYDRQIGVATNNAGKWTAGMKVNEVQLFGLAAAVTATAEKVKFLESIQKDLPDASERIAAAKLAEAQALQKYSAALEQNVVQHEQALETTRRSNQLAEKSRDLTLDQAQHEVALAHAKGDVEAATIAENKATDIQIANLQQSAAGRQDEIKAYDALIEATKRKMLEDGKLDESEKAQLATMAQTREGLVLEQKELGQAAEQTRDLADAKAEKKKADEEAAEASRKAAEAEKEHAAQAKKAAGLIDDAYNGAISSMAGLSEAAVAEFKRLRGEIVPVTDDLEALRDKAEKLDAALSRVGVADGMVAYLSGITRTANDVNKAFLGQAEAAERLTEQLNRIGETGGAAAGAMEHLIRQAENSGEQFRLLDQTRLDNLSAALDKANDKIREMQQETQDAQDRLAELNAELLESRGENEKAELLRQQLDYQQQLAEIERRRKEAELTGNRDLLSILNKQKDVLDSINAAKTASITADETANRNADNRTATNSGSGSGSGNASNATGKTYNLNLNVAGRSLAATTTTDPADWISELEKARRTAA